MFDDIFAPRRLSLRDEVQLPPVKHAPIRTRPIAALIGAVVLLGVWALLAGCTVAPPHPAPTASLVPGYAPAYPDRDSLGGCR